MVHPGELQALFAAETGVSLDGLRGKPFAGGDYAFRADPYGLRAGPTYRPAGPVLSCLTHLWIWRANRFSNSLVQLANSVSLARHLGVPNIVIPRFWYLNRGVQQYDKSLTLINLDEAEAFTPMGSELAIRGQFFYRETLKSLYPRDNRSEIISRFRHLFNLDLEPPPLPGDNLVIHIRSGDIFRDDGVNVGYGQPPLAYYQKVIEWERPDRIFLVYEDQENPVISALADHVQRLGIEFGTVSGDLKRDIEFLLRARVLVASRGSFLPGITALSRHARKVYYFESGYGTWGKTGIETIRVRDQQGEFVEKVLARWTNDLAQRSLMLDYPADNIQL